MTDLATWLLDRIAEDELWASQASPWATGSRDEGQPIAWKRHVWNWSPMRVLDECQAKRQIVEGYTRSVTRVVKSDGPPMPDLKYTSRGVEIWRPALREWHSLSQDEHKAILEAYTDPAPPPMTLRLLALPYADHPDYDPAWRL